MPDPQVFVLRVYRHDSEETGSVNGLIEVVQTEKQHAFKSLEELTDILRRELRANRKRGKGAGA
jgi:hypothetical protein